MLHNWSMQYGSIHYGSIHYGSIHYGSIQYGCCSFHFIQFSNFYQCYHCTLSCYDHQLNEIYRWTNAFLLFLIDIYSGFWNFFLLLLNKLLSSVLKLLFDHDSREQLYIDFQKIFTNNHFSPFSNVKNNCAILVTVLLIPFWPLWVKVHSSKSNSWI
jgi:hypothetical protein